MLLSFTITAIYYNIKKSPVGHIICLKDTCCYDKHLTHLSGAHFVAIKYGAIWFDTRVIHVAKAAPLRHLTVLGHHTCTSLDQSGAGESLRTWSSPQ